MNEMQLNVVNWNKYNTFMVTDDECSFLATETIFCNILTQKGIHASVSFDPGVLVPPFQPRYHFGPDVVIASLRPN